ncbi:MULTISPECIES: type III pantothenate kinase [Eubacterium]|uniref:Type III pantothenate kinase n=1 Tax=Eubacterium ruminantium TaxID=42322 RepID=A0A1T4PTW9_9FIRM|nr:MULTISPECIES: type III pantothenate kinase [Eubacterium]MCR5368978.1 type III pantothenate kinase [Eubacterium sp.]SCW62342.1 type III pantothenate kinase [Eubacterium ruminantium]SDN14491.1 type III pantothenate kinase [Eubacterium ruminantium]SJZ95005.1 type III pantothenate kinase [Eubacterium ruminantium]
MLFAIDVGNTNITIGLFDGKKLVNKFRMITQTDRTSDEYGVFLGEWLFVNHMKPTDITDVIVSSVVPNIMHSLTSGIIKYFNVTPVIVAPGIKTGINVSIPNPKELGADRLVDAVAAYEIYGGPIIVIDFGTATTHDLVLEDGTFYAGVTSPGIRLAANALWRGTAKLPEVEIKKVDTILGRDTVSSMQAGIYFGYIGQTEYIIKKLKNDSKLPNVKVVATGGLGKLISEATDQIDVYDPELTLHGLRIIYDKQ